MIQVFGLIKKLMLVCVALSFGALSLPAELKPLTVRGADLVDAEGRVHTLKGINLGNWFLFEKWMMDNKRPDGPPDHVSTVRLLRERFGEKRGDELVEIFRERWMQQRDFKNIRRWGFNSVRLPFHYAMLEDPARPGTVREGGFRWLDRAIAMATAEGLYTIVDMHGAPGAQSLDHVTGEQGRNEFWRPENRKRAAGIWEAIAARYRDNPAVVAYDLLNEPFNQMNMTHDDELLIAAMDELVRAVRRADPEKLIYVAGTFRGIEFYGPPAARGWRNVGYTEHFYPGLYGDSPDLFNKAKFFELKVAARARLLREWNVPFLVGEFNPVLISAGGPAMLRMHYDRYAAEGWAATMWTYKLQLRKPGPDDQPWSLVKNLHPKSPPDLTTASDGEIEAYFRAIGDMEYAENTAHIEALTAPIAPVVALPSVIVPELPPRGPVTGWTLTNVGDAYPRVAAREDDTGLTLWGGGRDVNGPRDEFGFASRQVSGDFEISGWVRFASDGHRFAKTGFMLRAGLTDDAPFALVHLFRDGQVVISRRDQAGQRMREEAVARTQAGSPVWLSLARRGDQVTLAWRHGVEDGGERTWQISAVAGEAVAGPFAMSYDPAYLQQVRFNALKWGR
ncbi:MAG: cellulase family glycosylhydrolase [Opitutaceae bacterium]|jgi:hypothetical protein|nr:cellulase family glycosylhydrolase [Opitutaceae bacterium]